MKCVKLLNLLDDEFQTVEETMINKTEIFIVDGGFLLHRFKWSKEQKTFKDICSGYINYIKKYYASSIIVFDGYDDKYSTKASEQRRRYATCDSPNFTIQEDSPVTVTQQKFLSNSNNKKQLIQMLTNRLSKENIEVKSASADADTLILNTAIERSRTLRTTIIGEDVDFLVILTALAPINNDIYFLKPRSGRVKTKTYSSRSLQLQYKAVKEFILLAHAFSGCDTTSSIFGKGKKQLLKLLQNEPLVKDVINTFNNKNSKHKEIQKAGETLFLYLYGDKSGKLSLNEYRCNVFKQSLLKEKSKL